jgi:hypothetical protein
MVTIFSPQWFLGFDIAIEFFILIVLSTFFILSIRSYRLSNKKNFLYLGAGFLLIALAQLSSVLTQIVLYYNLSIFQYLGQALVNYNFSNSFDEIIESVYFFGFFLNRFLTLLGLFLIYKLPSKEKESGDLVLAVYLLFVLCLFSPLNSQVYYIFHLTVLLILGLIIKNYYNIYSKNKNINTKMLVIVFGILLLSRINFLFLVKSPLFYVMGNIIELVGYVVLLLLMTRILRQSKKYKEI